MGIEFIYSRTLEEDEARAREELEEDDVGAAIGLAIRLMRRSPERAAAIAAEICDQSKSLNEAQFRFLLECIAVSPGARDVALSLLRGQESTERMLAVVALAYTKPPEQEAFPELVRLYEADPAMSLVARALPKFTTQRDIVRPLLEKVLQAGSVHARWLAAEAATQFPDPPASLVTAMEEAFKQGGEFSGNFTDSVRCKVLVALQFLDLSAVGKKLLDELAASESAKDQEDAQKLEQFVSWDQS